MLFANDTVQYKMYRSYFQATDNVVLFVLLQRTSSLEKYFHAKTSLQTSNNSILKLVRSGDRVCFYTTCCCITWAPAQALGC